VWLMDAINLPQFIEAYGLPGLIILGMGWVIRALWARLNEQIDNRFSDHKTHSSQMSDNTKTLEQALKIFERGGRG